MIIIEEELQYCPIVIADSNSLKKSTGILVKSLPCYLANRTRSHQMESNEDDPYDSPSCNGAKASKSNGFRNYSDMPVNTIEEPEKILLEETRCCARSKVFTEKTSDQRLQVMERDFLAAQRACFKQL